jgi:hypothetical protein
MSQRSARETEHAKGFRADAALHQAQFATVTETFEPEDQFIVGKRSFGRGKDSHLDPEFLL